MDSPVGKICTVGDRYRALSAVINNIDEIIVAYAQSGDVHIVAKKFGIKVSTLRSVLKRAGVYKTAKWWSSEDDEYLIDHYPTDSWDDLERHFYWLKRASIISRASKLRVRRAEHVWSDDEFRLVCDEYSKGTSIRKISEILGGKFSEAAIMTKLNKAGMKRRHVWTQDEIELLRRHYEVSTNEELVSLFPGIPLRYIQEKGRDLNLHSKAYLDRKWSDTEDSYVRANYDKMTDGDIAIALSRTTRAVKWRREKLGLFREVQDGVYEYLRKYLWPTNRAWRKASIQSCKYRCVVTGGKFDDVHHLYASNLILAEALDNLDLSYGKVQDFTEAELNAIATEYANAHKKYPLGVCLSHDVHMQFHNEYGYGNNTPEQFELFLKERYPTVHIPVTITEDW